METRVLVRQLATPPTGLTWHLDDRSLVAHDRYVSCIIDVAPAIHEEGFDIDLPVIADDDCFDLTDSAHNFPLKTQPRADQPSDMACFVCYLQMFRIVAFRRRAVVRNCRTDIASYSAYDFVECDQKVHWVCEHGAADSGQHNLGIDGVA